MNKKRYPFWLRFILFFIAFAVAFFLIIFLVDINLKQDLRMLFIKIGILATATSLFYNIFFAEPDSEIVE